MLSFNVALVQFKFNVPKLDIGESGNLSSQLYIIKNGQNEEDIVFNVTVISGSANNNLGNAMFSYYYYKVRARFARSLLVYV